MGKKSKVSTGAVIILLLMIVIGVAFGTGLYMYLQTQRSTIYLFKDNYKAGTLLSGEMLGAQEIDTETYYAMLNGGLAMYVTKEELTQAISNREHLATDVVKGLPVTTNVLVTSGGSGVESRLSENKVAVEVPAAKVSGLSGNEVGVGSRVNISTYYSVDEVSENDLIFQDLLVLDTITDEEGNVSAIFVECEPKDSVMLQYALVAETVSVSILKPGAYKPVKGNDTYYKKYLSREAEMADLQNSFNATAGADASAQPAAAQMPPAVADAAGVAE